MVLQAVGLTFTTVLYLSRVNWIRERALTGLSAAAVDTLLFSVLSIPLAIFGGQAVVGLLRRKKVAWLQAMSIQALLLIFALSSYVLQEANSLTYWTLVSCIIVVMYLNTHEVRTSFYTGADGEDEPILLFGVESESSENAETDGALGDSTPTEVENEEDRFAATLPPKPTHPDHATPVADENNPPTTPPRDEPPR